MDFIQTQRSLDLTGRLLDFMREFVYPAEQVYARQRREGDPHRLPPVVAELQAEARAQGLWNLFLRDERWGAGLTWSTRRWPRFPAAARSSRRRR